MPRGPRMWIVVAAFMAVAWFYAATLREAPASSDSLLPFSPAEAPSATPPALRMPDRNDDAPQDPFVPLLGETSEAELLPPLPPPPPPESVTTDPLLVTAPFKLTGVATGPIRRAVLEAAGTAYLVQEGDEVDGWVVTRIDASSVTIRSSAGAQITIELPDTSGQADSPQ